MRTMEKRDFINLLIYVFAVSCIIIGFCSCRNVEYIPTEKTIIEHVYHNDAIRQTDSVKTEKNTILRVARPEDSLMIAQLGIKLSDNERLLILLQNEIIDTRNQLYESHNRDSVRVDSIPVPVPVERKLNKWEKVCLDYGMVMMGCTIMAIILVVFLIIRWIRQRLFIRS